MQTGKYLCMFFHWVDSNISTEPIYSGLRFIVTQKTRNAAPYYISAALLALFINYDITTVRIRTACDIIHRQES